jgi:hypothetical protein
MMLTNSWLCKTPLPSYVIPCKVVTLKWPLGKPPQVVWKGGMRNFQPCLETFNFLSVVTSHYITIFNGILVEFLHSTNVCMVCPYESHPKSNWVVLYGGLSTCFLIVVCIACNFVEIVLYIVKFTSLIFLKPFTMANLSWNFIILNM